MKTKIFFLLTLIFFIVCSQPKIDTSSDEKMRNSIDEVKKTLSIEKREKFEESLQLIILEGFGLQNLISENGNIKSDLEVKKSINGKTADEIIAYADKIKKEREIKEREQCLQEIQELKKRKQIAEEHRKEITKFEISRSRFYKSEGTFGEEAVIEISVINNTSYPISRVYFMGTLSSIERTIPWHKESFNYEIPGGLEPNEIANWRLSPNMFSDWNEVQAPRDAIFTVEVIQLDGANGEKLFSSQDFSEEDEKRLQELTTKYFK